MNSVVQAIEGAGAMSASGRGGDSQPSRLLPSVFERLVPGKRMTVLEVGSAIPETIEFFGQFKSRLFVSNLYDEALVREQQEELSEKEMKQAFQDALDFPYGTMIDICLFWDFLNYLKRPALRAFSTALRPYVHPGTRAHGFSVLNVNTPLRNQKYGLLSPDTLSVRKSSGGQLAYYPHTHEELDEALCCFRVKRGWLLPDGRLEILLSARV